MLTWLRQNERHYRTSNSEQAKVYKRNLFVCRPCRRSRRHRSAQFPCQRYSVVLRRGKPNGRIISFVLEAFCQITTLRFEGCAADGPHSTVDLIAFARTRSECTEHVKV
eukprot:413584-Rhodomonas_salina.1